MPPAIIRETMVQDLLDFIREAIPIIHEASTELLELILENDPSTSNVATFYRRWIRINLMRQLLPLEEEERQEWLIDLFSGRQNTVEYFAETMLLNGIWTESKDKNGFLIYRMHRLKETNFRNWLLRPEIQEIYKIQVLELLPRIPNPSIEGSDYITNRGSKSRYKIVIPNWKQEIITMKKELAVSQSQVEELREELRRANDVIASQVRAMSVGINN
ncbi:02e167f7-e099-4724-8060-0418241c357d [Sclerotinia trifoliorum]|uniref:02e167f7-e099-4724-8060-0418241c357d n=1 Tax=Sclerotinia trifoliorum TaxID=28548 RepID=A0A8H2W3G4_9HELO|nr:02e167f7-e099-4724-8060-0418241c357d [Sclerotinia trifoliorum]